MVGLGLTEELDLKRGDVVFAVATSGLAVLRCLLFPLHNPVGNED